MYGSEFSLAEALHNLMQMGVAYLLALPIAWNREEKSRSAGLRTYPLVAMACCGFMLTGIYIFSEEHALSRVFQGIIGGMGFIGGGAILKNKDSVKGTATAASLWGTGAIAVAVAWKLYEIAATLSLVSFLTLSVLQQLKTKINGEEA